MFSYTVFELMALMLSAISAMGVLIIAMQLMALRRVYMQESKANQMERTLKAVELPPKVTSTIGEIIHRHYRGDLEEIYSEPNLNQSLYETLNTLENLSVGILSGVYNEEIAYAQLGNSLPMFYNAVQRSIYESRGDFSSASQYIKLEQLARSWSSGDYRSRSAGGNYE
ncbi:hypothetical protein ABRZ81_23480 [Vibrio vulnificus]|uniref:DUF4760 domain-containing protein n=1 Tax=Vibrio vulnificus TaxID=672 RepID=UPI0032EBFD34